MPQKSLNLIAISIFSITLLALVGPIFQISPTIPAGVTAIVLGLATVDTLSWKNRGATLLLDLFSSKTDKERVIIHEAGHFLVAYLLGIPIRGYTLTAWEAWRQDYPGKGGVMFEPEAIANTPGEKPQFNELLDSFCLVWSAGIAAELLTYGDAWGGRDDEVTLKTALTTAGIPSHLQRQRLNLALLRAKDLLQEHSVAYQNLVQAMDQRLSLEDCYQAIKS